MAHGRPNADVWVGSDTSNGVKVCRWCNCAFALYLEGCEGLRGEFALKDRDGHVRIKLGKACGRDLGPVVANIILTKEELR